MTRFLAPLALFAAPLLLAACSSSGPLGETLYEERELTVLMGVTPVDVVTTTARPGSHQDLVWFNMHDDENTGVDAVSSLLRRAGGTVVQLKHTGERLIRFEVRQIDGAFFVDPNRIFTDAGARKSLADQNDLGESAVPEEALRATREFADQVLAMLDLGDAQAVLTLHNNTDDNYSVRSYQPGGAYETDAARVHLADGGDPDDFFFVTDAALYEALVARGFSAILQDNAKATDDGSLSVYAAQNGLPYVNVEAQHGHEAEQAAMIRALMEVLAARR